MSSYFIGISGITAAQKALDVIGNNMANAATEGYHRQRIELQPAYSSQLGTAIIGGGVESDEVTRLIDTLLEQQILRQGSVSEQLSQELSTLKTVEGAFGEFSQNGGLNQAIDKFFSALHDLCAHPNDVVYQNQAVSAGDAMANQFRSVGQSLSQIQTQLTLEGQNVAEQVNELTGQIASLNDYIERIEVAGNKANNLSDQRDKCITELSKLIGIETVNRDYGVIDVAVGGIPLVTGSSTVKIQFGLDEQGKAGVAAAGSYSYETDIQGGKLAAIVSCKNTLVSGVQDDLDSLAGAIIQQVNKIQVQGIGSYGSFTKLSGRSMPSEALADFLEPGSDKAIYVRVTDTNTGLVKRYKIDVDVATDTLTTIADKIKEIDGLDASVNNSALEISAKAGYKFDFVPACLSEPTSSNLTGTSPPTVSVSGIYTGTENQVFTCTVVGSGDVGNENLSIEVRDGSDNLVNTISVGAGYSAGDKIELADGIEIALSSGDLNDGDNFTIEALANSDTSGLLAAAGLNTFFAGSGASDIEVAKAIVDQPDRIGTAIGQEGTDNVNAQRLADLSKETVESLGDMTVGDFYRKAVTYLGQVISVKQTSADSIDAILKDLNGQQSDLSGVNINDEATQMLMFQQMFGAMAKYITVVKSSIDTIMDII